MENKTIFFSHKQLFDFCLQVFVSCGMTYEDATLASNVLIEADLRGIDSHGVARLSGYIRLYKKGRANFSAKPKIVHQTASTANIDADNGLGLVVTPYAMNIAIEKAKQSGTGWICIHNSNHFGIAAYHAMLAVEKEMIGIAMTNATPLVAPTNSAVRMLGTNPLSVAIPSKKYPPFVLDMASSNAANGKLEIAQRNNSPIPTGWVQTKNGMESTNPYELKEGGSLLPLGGHKGYGLSAAIDILSAVLSGANYGPWVPPFVAFLEPKLNLPGKGIGHFVGAMCVDAFRPKEEFFMHIDNWIETFKNTQPINMTEPVLIPGEPEFIEKQNRLQNGIPLNDNVLEDLQNLAKELGIAFIE